MREKPSQSQIESYLKWLKDPEGDAHLQMSLPLGSDIRAEASSDRPDYVKSITEHAGSTEPTESPDTASQAVHRIRVLACSGMSIRDISERTGCDERFVKTVIFEPGKLNRRYE